MIVDEQIFEIALYQIKAFEADLGGTEILKPLETVFNKKLSEDYERQIFLITDGAVDNTDNIIQSIN